MAKVLMVVGLLLSTDKVLLISKNRPEGYKGAGRPEWQNGLLNGLGGVVSDDETPIQCLTRKVEAECGLKTTEKQWKPVHILLDGDAEIRVYARFLSDQDAKKLLSPTDEAVGLYYRARLSTQNTVPNIQWLVPFAWQSLDGTDKQIGFSSYNSTDLSDMITVMPTFYVIVNKESASRLTVIERDRYEAKAMTNPVVYAGTEQEAEKAAGQYDSSSPYPFTFTDGGQEVAQTPLAQAGPAGPGTAQLTPAGPVVDATGGSAENSTEKKSGTTSVNKEDKSATPAPDAKTGSQSGSTSNSGTGSTSETKGTPAPGEKQSVEGPAAK